MKPLIYRTLGIASVLLLMTVAVQAGQFLPNTFELFGQTFTCSQGLTESSQKCRSSELTIHATSSLSPSVALNTMKQSLSYDFATQSAQSFPCSRNGESVHLVTSIDPNQSDDTVTVLGKSSSRYFLWFVMYEPVDDSMLEELCDANF